MKKDVTRPADHHRRRAVLRQQRAEGVEQRQMLSLQREVSSATGSACGAMAKER